MDAIEKSAGCYAETCGAYGKLLEIIFSGKFDFDAHRDGLREIYNKRKTYHEAELARIRKELING